MRTIDNSLNQYDLEDFRVDDEISIALQWKGVYTAVQYTTVLGMLRAFSEMTKENPEGVKIEVFRFDGGTKEVDGRVMPARRRVMARELSMKDVRRLATMIQAA